MKKLKIFFAVIIVSFISVSVKAQNKLVFSTINDGIEAKLAENILIQAYRSLGIDFKIVEYPALRAINEANAGHTDGELYRIKGVDAEYKNLLMIPVFLFEVDAVVFTKKLNIEVAGFESLKNYSIAFHRGIKFVEYGSKGMERTIVNSLEHAFLLLNKERVDIVVDTLFSGLDIIKRKNYKTIMVLEPPLKRVDVYHYLNKKHEDLVPKISASLQKMHKEGIIEKEKASFIKELQKF